MSKPDVSIILACYNEAEHFTGSMHRIIRVLKKNRLAYEIIFVDDYSLDDTKTVIRSYMVNNPRLPLSALFHRRNEGRGKAVQDGIIQAKGTYVGFLDIDLEVGPEYIPLCLKKLKAGYDVVCANRTYEFQFRSLTRWLASKIYRWFSHRMLKHEYQDTEAGYKFFRRQKIIPVLKKTRNKHWFWDTEIMILAGRSGLKIAEVDMQFIRRPDKTSTVRLIPDTIEYIRSVWRFRKRLPV